MDVVYLVKNSHVNEELRHSLRSLQNIPHDAVHFVGHHPRWVRNVIHHAYDPGNPPLREKHAKWWKTWHMMRFLCTLDEISEDFIFFNDDFYVMRPIEEVPTYHRGPISEIVQSYKTRYRATNIYLTTMVETQELLRALQKPTLCYEIHTPMVVNRHKMIDCINLVEAMSRPGQMHINKRSLYGNYWEIGGRRRRDVKVDSARPHLDKESEFLSSSDNAFDRREIGPYVRQSFPDPSPYEIDGINGSTHHHRTPRTGRWASSNG